MKSELIKSLMKYDNKVVKKIREKSNDFLYSEGSLQSIISLNFRYHIFVKNIMTEQF